MKILLAILALALASCSSSPVEGPQEKTVPTVRVPELAKAPDTSPVEEAAAEMKRDLDTATAEIRTATDKVEEGVKEASILRNLTAEALEQASLETEILLSKINDAAEVQSRRLEETAEMLVKATTSLAAANERSATLSREVARLRADVAVQTERAVELQASVRDANERTLDANLQKDQFRNALNESTGKIEAVRAELDQVKAHRLKLMIGLGLSLALLAAAAYMMIKI